MEQVRDFCLGFSPLSFLVLFGLSAEMYSTRNLGFFGGRQREVALPTREFREAIAANILVQKHSGVLYVWVDSLIAVTLGHFPNCAIPNTSPEDERWASGPGH